MRSVVWNFDTYENYSEIKNKFAKYLKGSCRLSFGTHLSFKYFLNIVFVREISLK